MLDSGEFASASEARVDVRSAIEWARKAWEQVSVKTVRYCWNHAKILPVPVSAAGPDENCLLYTSPSPRDRTRSRMPSSA